MKKWNYIWLIALVTLLLILPFQAMANQAEPVIPEDEDVSVLPEPTVPKTYTVRFVNYDGSVILENTYDYGDAVAVPAETPTRPNEGGTGYTFIGWDQEVSVYCIGNATYTAQYKEGVANGWVLEGGIWYYYENGTMLKNTWKLDSTGWCYLGADGKMATNKWILDSVGWCYVGADGYCVTSCWKQDSTGWCYLDAQGRMVTNGWVLDGGKWYYLDGNGYMVSNQWRKDSKGWCWLTASGAMATNQWVKDSKGWCYIGADGYCWTSRWAQDSIGWIWLDSEGSMTKSQWIYTGGSWYYLDAEGYMLYNTTWNGYRFNDSGVCTNP